MRTHVLLSLAVTCLVSTALAQQPVNASDRFTTESRVYYSSGPAVVNIGVFVVSIGSDDTLSLKTIPASSQQISQGTGVIIDERGLVITNAHVVNHKTNRGTIVYKLSFAEQFGGETVLARLLSVDEQSDLALLKIISGEKYAPIVFAKENDLMIGEKVIAIGSPLGNSHSLTSGILSGVNRDINVSVARGQEIKFKGLIQTDAAINFGNSGGPLLNSLGELIGINNATAQSADGIGYAIPIDQVNKILRERLRRPNVWLGVQVVDEHDLTLKKTHVRSPAVAQGLMVGDTISAINSVVVNDLVGLNNELTLIESMKEFTIEVKRGQRVLVFNLSLPHIDTRDTLGALGLDGTPDVVRFRDEFGRLNHSRVVKVKTVLPNSPASALGINVGDHIHALRLKVGRARQDGWTPVASMAQVVQLIKSKNFIRNDYNIMWYSSDGSHHQGKLSVAD